MRHYSDYINAQNPHATWLELLAELQLQLEHRIDAKHGNANRLSYCADCSQRTRIKNGDDDPTLEKVDAGHLQVTVISLAPTVPGAKLQRQKRPLFRNLKHY